MSTHGTSATMHGEELSPEAKRSLCNRPYFLFARGVFLLAQAWGLCLLVALMCVPTAMLVWVYRARVEDCAMKSRSLTALWSLWRRPTAWVVLGPVVLVWLFYFGAFWSISDRVRLVDHPKPFPGERLFRPEGLMGFGPAVDRLGPEFGWARTIKPMWDGPVCFRIRPGTVYYIPRPKRAMSSGVRELDWARATTPWWERAQVE